ncbi:hypothetical protein BaRGS_00031219 [Batillaria attramentaria]|uniref:Peptidase M14 domain-containing protein n=1 Tax=Batillaria attramentaria TaxID=370345 RepID=A0ABD0JSC7_9CAEN
MKRLFTNTFEFPVCCCQMKRFLRRVKREATEADVSLYSMGKSFEGRKMPVVTLALNPDNDDEVKDMLQMFDWFIAPIVNPDGYAYSRAKPENRLWRKTRSDKHMNGTGCVGVDANRNFGFDWNPESGASSDPCSPVFAGPAPFSEPETRNIRDWLKKLSDRTALFSDLARLQSGCADPAWRKS